MVLIKEPTSGVQGGKRALQAAWRLRQKASLFLCAPTPPDGGLVVPISHAYPMSKHRGFCHPSKP
jgi:hypothetical protein